MKQGTTHTLNIRQQRKVTPEKWDANKQTIAYFLEKVSGLLV